MNHKKPLKTTLTNYYIQMSVSYLYPNIEIYHYPNYTLKNILIMQSPPFIILLKNPYLKKKILILHWAHIKQDVLIWSVYFKIILKGRHIWNYEKFLKNIVKYIQVKISCNSFIILLFYNPILLYLYLCYLYLLFFGWTSLVCLIFNADGII